MVNTPSGWKNELDVRGATLVPSLINDEQIAGLIAACETALTVSETDKRHAIRNLLARVPEAAEIARSKDIRALVEETLGQSAVMFRGLYFDKTPDSNWLVPWHQDLTIAVKERQDNPGFGPWSTKEGVAHVQPPEPWLSGRLAIRLHLDDCGPENGPLKVIPGSHRFGRLEGNEIDQMRVARKAAICIANRGDALLMNPMLLHASSQADSPGHRRVIHLEFCAYSLPGTLEWHGLAE